MTTLYCTKLKVTARWRYDRGSSFYQTKNEIRKLYVKICIFNILIFTYYKGLIVKPVVAPVLIAAHHVNGHLPSLDIDNIFSDENDLYKLTNKLTEKGDYILYMCSSPGTNRYILYNKILYTNNYVGYVAYLLKDERNAAVIGSFRDMTKVERLLNKKTLEEVTINECEDINTAVKVNIFTLMYN